MGAALEARQARGGQQDGVELALAQALQARLEIAPQESPGEVAAQVAQERLTTRRSRAHHGLWHEGQLFSLGSEGRGSHEQNIAGVFSFGHGDHLELGGRVRREILVAV